MLLFSVGNEDTILLCHDKTLMELDGSLPYFQNVTALYHRIYAELFTAQWLLLVFVPPDGLSNVPCTLPT
jgi:hypothetical protein